MSELPVPDGHVSIWLKGREEPILHYFSEEGFRSWRDHDEEPRLGIQVLCFRYETRSVVYPFSSVLCYSVTYNSQQYLTDLREALASAHPAHPPAHRPWLHSCPPCREEGATHG